MTAGVRDLLSRAPVDSSSKSGRGLTDQVQAAIRASSAGDPRAGEVQDCQVSCCACCRGALRGFLGRVPAGWRAGKPYGTGPQAPRSTSPP